jgi:hypothetical protein
MGKLLSNKSDNHPGNSSDKNPGSILDNSSM